jgi:O-antigen/teichoic acid export membrane protein
MKYARSREPKIRPGAGITEMAMHRVDEASNPSYPSASSGSLRTRRMRLAVMTSVVSKVATIAFQLLAIPVAIHALGPAQYGAFLVVSSILAWISLGGLGVAPGVTGFVARAIGRDSATEARQVVTTGLVLSVGAAIATAVVAGAVITMLSVGDVVGLHLEPSFVPYLPAMTAAMIVVAVTGLIQFPTSVMQAARAGALEQHISNVWRIVGTIVGVAGMFVVAARAPTMVGFAMALAAPAVVAGVGDSLAFLVRHPEMAPSISSFRRSLLRPLVSTGAGFLAFSAGGFLISGLSLVIASGSVTAEQLAPIGILFQLQALGVGVVNMVAIPLWPSVAHADAASDHQWVVRAYRALRWMAIAVGLLGAFGIIVILPAAAVPLFGNSVSFDIGLTVPFGALFVVACWGMLHAFVLFGVGSALSVGVLTVVQGLLGLAVLVATIGILGPSAVGISALVAALAVTTWALPRILYRRFEAAAS